jgi:ssDNA-binding Zn-finger/Zn-ribbon topoisomerase 1
VKRSKFFCENCHHEVRPNAKVCPHCGRFFEAVRCPICSFVGEASDFSRGCPNCGYAGGDPVQDRGFEQVDYTPESGGKARGAGRTRSSAQTPGWVWPLAIGILLAVFIGLVVLYSRL